MNSKKINPDELYNITSRNIETKVSEDLSKALPIIDEAIKHAANNCKYEIEVVFHKTNMISICQFTIKDIYGTWPCYNNTIEYLAKAVQQHYKDLTFTTKMTTSQSHYYVTINWDTL